LREPWERDSFRAREWQNRWAVALGGLLVPPAVLLVLFGVVVPLLSRSAPGLGWERVAWFAGVGVAAALSALVAAFAFRWSNREGRTVVRRAVSMGLLGAVVAVVGGWLAWWGWRNGSVVTVELLALAVAGVMAAPLVWFASVGGDADGWACAGCGYERPARREVASGVCTECGNDWWRDAFGVSSGFAVRALFRPVPGAVRTAVGARARRARGRVKRFSGALGFVPTVFFLPLLGGPFVIGWLPTPAVVFMAERSGPLVGGSWAFEEVWEDRAGVSRATRERLLRRAIERRAAGWRPDSLVDDALLGGAAKHGFDAGLLEAYFGPTVELRLAASPGAGGRYEVRFEGDLGGFAAMGARVLVLDVRAVGGSVVRRGGAGGKAGAVPVPTTSMARRTVLRERFGGRVFHVDEVTDGSAGWAVVEPDAVAGGAGGDAGEGLTVEVEVWVEGRSGGVSPASHRYFDAEGGFVEPSGVVWGERRVVRLSLGGR